MLDLWMALGGEPDAFDRMLTEDRRTPGDTWSQLLAIVRGITWEALAEGDTNPPPGPEIEALMERRANGADRKLGLIGRDDYLTEVLANRLHDGAARYERTPLRLMHRGRWFALRNEGGHVWRASVVLDNVNGDEP